LVCWPPASRVNCALKPDASLRTASVGRPHRPYHLPDADVCQQFDRGLALSANSSHPCIKKITVAMTGLKAQQTYIVVATAADKSPRQPLKDL
jgi:hypothetical protein